VVGCFDVLEHIPQDQEVLASIHAALVPGGGLLLTVPQHPRLWSRHDETARHVRRYTAEGLTRKLAAAGFELVARTSFVTLLLPLMLLSRLRERGPGQGETEGFAVGGPANAVLHRVMRIERALIAAGLRLPFGGSLLLVAARGRRPA